MKKYFLILLLLVSLISCKNFFYGIGHNFGNVKDVNYYLEGIPSYQVNTGDRYCLYYDGTRNQINIEPFEMEKVNYKMAEFLKSKNVKVKEEVFIFKYSNGIEKDRIEKNIKQREIDNNFENCDYLIGFSLENSTDYKREIILRMRIDNIKDNKNIGFYRMREMGPIFKKSTQEQRVEKMLNEWWETQIKPQPKARPLERYCVGNCDNKL